MFLPVAVATCLQTGPLTMGKRVFWPSVPEIGVILENEFPRCLELRKKFLETNSRLQMDPTWIPESVRPIS